MQRGDSCAMEGMKKKKIKAFPFSILSGISAVDED